MQEFKVAELLAGIGSVTAGFLLAGGYDLVVLHHCDSDTRDTFVLNYPNVPSMIISASAPPTSALRTPASLIVRDSLENFAIYTAVGYGCPQVSSNSGIRQSMAVQMSSKHAIVKRDKMFASGTAQVRNFE